MKLPWNVDLGNLKESNLDGDREKTEKESSICLSRLAGEVVPAGRG